MFQNKYWFGEVTYGFETEAVALKELEGYSELVRDICFASFSYKFKQRGRKNLYYILEIPRHLKKPIFKFINSLSGISMKDKGYVNSFTLSNSPVPDMWSRRSNSKVRLVLNNDPEIASHCDRHLVQIKADTKNFPKDMQNLAKEIRLYFVLLVLRLFSADEDCFTPSEINSVEEISWKYFNSLSKNGRNGNHMFAETGVRERVKEKHLANIFNDEFLQDFLKNHTEFSLRNTWSNNNRISQTKIMSIMLREDNDIDKFELEFPVFPVKDSLWKVTEDEVKYQYELLKLPYLKKEEEPEEEFYEEDEEELHEEMDEFELENVPEDWDGDAPVIDCHCDYCEGLREEIQEFKEMKGE